MEVPQRTTGTARIVGERYRLLRRLDHSESVETWEAYDERLDRTVALKLAADDARHDRVVEERVRAAARGKVLGHGPEAARILDGGEDTAYGPFAVAELNDALEQTQTLSVVTSSVSTRLEGAPMSVRENAIASERPRPTVGLPVLLAVLLLSVGALLFLGRALAPSVETSASAIPTAATQPARPAVSGPASKPTSAPTLVPTLAPAAPRATVAPSVLEYPGSPVDTIRQHYALITDRRYSEGYQLMDAHLRSLNSQSEYDGWFANKISITPVSIELISQNDQQAIVRTVVQSVDRVNGHAVATQVSEQFVLHYEDKAWRIDQVSPL